MKIWSILIIMVLISACDWQLPQSNEGIVQQDSLIAIDSLAAKADTVASDIDNTINRDTAAIPHYQIIDTKNIRPEDLMRFAESLKGVPYKYGSTDPRVGFDCSGFITYVFNHFGITVPRSSVDFTDVGKPISKEAAKRGDIILFTGTDSTERFVGHMGLITSNENGELQFIHSTSGKAYSVTVTPLNDYYMSRFVKTLRIFPQND